MKNKIKTAVEALWLALCFLTVFFCCTEEVCAESGQLTHRHTGSSENGGGCYGERKSVTWDCHSYDVSTGFNGTEYIYVCGQCGSRWSGPGKVDEPRCSGQGTTTYYEVNCGKGGAAAVSFSCEKSTQGWAKELDLTASYSVHEEGINISGFLWNGSPGGTRCHVTENGTYTLRLAGSGNVDFSPTVSVKVDHIDNTPPSISSFQTASDAWASSVQLIVNASDGQSGLAGEAYSYDGGASWSASNTHTVTANGGYSVRVRDAVGNVSTAETTVEHIDCTPPTIAISTTPSVDNWYDGGLTVTIQAQDAGGGLADAPYSFDGGATYLVGNSATLSGSGTLEIAVADRAGNVTRLSFHAEKKQRPQPTPAPDSGSGFGTGNTGSGSGAGGGNTGSGAGNTGSLSGTGGSGSAAGAGGTGTGSAGAGGENGVGPDGAGMDGTNGSGSSNGGTGTGGPDTNGTGTGGITEGGTGSGSGNGNTGADGGGTVGADDAGIGADVSGISNGTGSSGRGQRSAQGNQNAGGTEDGAGNSKGGKKDRYGLDWDGADEMQSDAEGILPQHYPGGLPRVGSMTNGHQNESGTDSADGAGDMGGIGGIDGIGGTDGAGDSNGTESTDEIRGSSGTDGAREEEAIIQNELLAPAGEQEAAILQRTGASAGAELPYVSMPVLVTGVASLAAAGVFGWALLFGVRVDTRDEKGHYRFAGITRVTTKEQERLRVVPLTKQIIRNSHTNELRIRFGPLCHKRCEGETLLLRYRSIRREFKAQRTVELHIRA